MTRNVQWVPPDETVSAAAKLMAFHNIGFLPICRPNAMPIGVLTDRDIALRVVGEDRFAALTKVREVMSLPVRFVRPETPTDRLSEIMTNEGISRLPVLDNEGQLVGVVSLSDMLVHASANLTLDRVRGLYAREGKRGSPNGLPPIATAPSPDYFKGRPAPAPIRPASSLADDTARREAEDLAQRGTIPLKESPV
jgi:predicted transcriptional regulator